MCPLLQFLECLIPDGRIPKVASETVQTILDSVVLLADRLHIDDHATPHLSRPVVLLGCGPHPPAHTREVSPMSQNEGK